jgi:[acyl-carrier-protein] S-malonyltransferase
MVVSGGKSDIQYLLDIAQQEGAFSVSELTVDTPYHSKYLRKLKDEFSHFVNEFAFRDAAVPVISTYDQREVIKSRDIQKEVVYNLTEKINWYKTMQYLLKKNVRVFYECGAGKDLTKIARFIQGDYKIIPVTKF